MLNMSEDFNMSDISENDNNHPSHQVVVASEERNSKRRKIEVSNISLANLSSKDSVEWVKSIIGLPVCEDINLHCADLWRSQGSGLAEFIYRRVIRSYQVE